MKWHSCHLVMSLCLMFVLHIMSSYMARSAATTCASGWMPTLPMMLITTRTAAAAAGDSLHSNSPAYTIFHLLPSSLHTSISAIIDVMANPYFRITMMEDKI